MQKDCLILLAAAPLGPVVGESVPVSPLRTGSQFAIALWVSQIQVLLVLKARCFGGLSLSYWF